jgi:DNA-binding transcriptional LysR family regulator
MYEIDDITVFCRVVDLESFSAAGRDLRISTAVVSSRIHKLEQKLGVRLLHRTTRSVWPTEAGELYYSTCQSVLNQFADCQNELDRMKAAPEGVIKISAPYALGRSVIAPILGEFKNEYPSIDIRLDVTDRAVNLVEEKVDLALRQGYLPDSSWVMRPLVPDHRITAGSDDYLDRSAELKTPYDLKNHSCLLLRFPGSTRFRWQFLINGKLESIAITGGLDASSSEVLTDWAINGKGLVQQSIWTCAGALSDASLKPVLQKFEPQNLGIRALMPERKGRALKVELLLDYLAEKLKTHPTNQLIQDYLS